MKKLQYMQIVNHYSFKKLAVSLLSIIIPFHVYLDSRWHCTSKNNQWNPKPNKTPKNPPGLGFFKNTRVFLNPEARDLHVIKIQADNEQVQLGVC